MPRGARPIAGRLLRAADYAPGAPLVAVVNETLARRFFPGQDPLGHQITVGRDKSRRSFQIIGLVSDAKYQRLQETPRAVAYLPWLQQRGGNMFVEVRMADRAPVAEAVRSEVRGVLDPLHEHQPFGTGPDPVRATGRLQGDRAAAHAPAVKNSRGELIRNTLRRSLELAGYGTRFIAQPIDFVTGWGTGLPAKTASSASRRSAWVA